jgi:putative transposase
LQKTRIGKSELDAGGGMHKRHLRYKGEYASRCVKSLDEGNTTRACSSCGVLTGPGGLDSLVVRSGMGSGCGDTQDTDVKAARNIPFRGEVHPVRVRERVITVRGAAEPDN